MSKELDAIDLKVKELLGINPYPNKCQCCGLKSSTGQPYQLTKFEINTVDGNVYCSGCHQPVKLGRINTRTFDRATTFKMNTLRRKKK